MATDMIEKIVPSYHLGTTREAKIHNMNLRARSLAQWQSSQASSMFGNARHSWLLHYMEMLAEKLEQ